MNQKDYHIPEDFILDDQFCEWIYSGKTKHRTLWENWMDQHPETLSSMEEAELLIQSFQFQERTSLDAQTVSQEWEKVARQIEQTPPLNQKRTFPKVYGIAAAIAFLIGLSFVITLFNNQEKNFETPYGKIQTLELSDGSKVILQANSSLRLPKKWSNDQLREVWLEGEAYFEVAPAAGSKNTFIVHAGELNIEVLGTQFNVINRAVRKQVVLEEGKINLRVDNPMRPIQMDSLQGVEQRTNSVILAPGELVALSKKQQHFTRTSVDTKLYTSWIQEKWRFKNTPIAEIVQLIEDNYGLTSVFENETLQQKLINGTVPSNDLNTLLKGLEQLFDVKIERSGSQLLFSA